MDYATIITAAIAAVAANAVGLFLIRPNRKKIEAEAAKIITGQALAMVEAMEDQVETLTKKLRAFESRVDAVEEENRQLRAVNRTLLEGAIRLEEQVRELATRLGCEAEPVFQASRFGEFK